MNQKDIVHERAVFLNTFKPCIVLALLLNELSFNRSFVTETTIFTLSSKGYILLVLYIARNLMFTMHQLHGKIPTTKTYQITLENSPKNVSYTESDILHVQS